MKRMNNPPILIAEDEDNDVFFLKRAMQKAGVSSTIHVVETGQAALDYLRGEGVYADRVVYPAPHLLLLDLKLPCFSGIDVLKWIRQNSTYRRMPVVVLSSSTLTLDIQEAYDAGANAYAVKPSDPDELVRLMQAFADWWLKQNVSVV